MNALYTTTATSTGDGRSGHVRTDDGQIDLDLMPPVELGGRGGSTNPEQLFAAGYAACFHSALRMSAAKAHVRTESTVMATVGIGPNEEGGFALQVALEVALPGVEQSVAEDLVQTAHGICPYSNATRGNVPVELTVSTSEPVTA